MKPRSALVAVVGVIAAVNAACSPAVPDVPPASSSAGSSTVTSASTAAVTSVPVSSTAPPPTASRSPDPTTSSSTTPPVSAAVPVDSVYDADTLRVLLGGTSTPVRVLGIDASELRPAECWGPESRDAARALLLGQSVVLTPDAAQGDADHYGRLLRYVQLPDGRDLGATLIATGNVVVYEQYPVAKTPEYRDVQIQARAERQGLWAACWQ